MDSFDATGFCKRLRTGEFDGRLVQEFGKLTRDQLEQVALLMARSERSIESDAQEPRQLSADSTA